MAKNVRTGGSPFGRLRPALMPNFVVLVSKNRMSFAVEVGSGGSALSVIEAVENLYRRLLSAIGASPVVVIPRTVSASISARR
jgi:hypothetical protein